MVKKLQKDFFVIGDNAYPLSDALQIPFSGADKHDDFNHAFNYWLSQLRIRIEMAFGLLTTKWRIFRGDLTCCTARNSQIIRVAAKLHNFVINYDKLMLGRDVGENFEDVDAFGVEPLPGGPDDNRGFLPSEFSLSEEEAALQIAHQEERMQEGWEGMVVEEEEVQTTRRDRILQALKERGMDRPAHNKRRNPV